MLWALLALCIALAPLSPVLAAPALQTGSSTGLDSFAADLAYCEGLEAEALRDELNRISQTIFAEGEAGLDVDAIVDREWQALRIDAAIDRSVTEAVDRARARRDWLARFLSGWSPAQAEALTAEIAADAFASEPFTTAMDGLAQAVALGVATEFAALSAESAAQTTFCLQTYIGSNYSQAFVTAFADEVRAGAEQADLNLDEHLDSGLMTVLGQHRAALGGVGVIIVSQIAGRIVQRIGQDLARRVAGRVAGRVLGRVGAAAIPALGWIVGIGLLVYDVAQGADGALPQIETGLQSTEVKAAIRAAVVDEVGPELRTTAPQMARELSNELYAEWLDFQRKYGQVLNLAQENTQFGALLSEVSDVAHLSTLVDVLLTSVGRAGLDSAVADGTFLRLLNLPPASVEILRGTGDVNAPLAWANLAGAQLDQVVALEIYKHQSPDALDRSLLSNLLALNDPTAVARLVLLEPSTIATLLTISSANLGELAARLSAVELAQLAEYITELDAPQANQVVAAVLQSPELMERLHNDGLLNLLANTGNLTAALGFLSTPADITRLPGDLWMALSGQVPRLLFVHKYGWVWTLGLFAATLLVVTAVAYSVLAWLTAPWRRIVGLFGGRRRAPQANRPPEDRTGNNSMRETDRYL